MNRYNRREETVKVGKHSRPVLPDPVAFQPSPTEIDHFQNDIIGVPGTWVSFNSPIAVDSIGSFLHIATPQGMTPSGIYKPVSGPCTLETVVADFGIGMNAAAGLCLLDTTLQQSYFFALSNLGVISYDGKLAKITPTQGQARYLRAVLDGSTGVGLYASYKGLTWSSVGTVTLAFTPAFAGLAARSTEAYFDYFKTIQG